MKFSIRDLIWLTIVVALVSSWFLTHTRMFAGLESETRRRLGVEQQNSLLQTKVNYLEDEVAELHRNNPAPDKTNPR